MNEILEIKSGLSLSLARAGDQAHKREYSTGSPSNNKSFRLDSIIKELGIDPIFIYENLDSDGIRKQVLNDARGLSGIYMIGRIIEMPLIIKFRGSLKAFDTKHLLKNNLWMS